MSFVVGDHCPLFTGTPVVVEVAHNAVLRGHGPGKDRRVTDGGVSRQMLVVGIGEHRAFVHQPPEAAGFKQIGETFEVVVAELIYDDDEYKPWLAASIDPWRPPLCLAWPLEQE